MGSICSCLGHDEPESFLQLVVDKCKSLFHRDHIEVASSDDVAETSTASLSIDNIHSEMHQNWPEDLVEPLNKVVTQTEDNGPQQRETFVQQGSQTLAIKAEENKVRRWEDLYYSSEIFPSSDDEDVCPTCLEEYDEENPKILTQCNHHYHLACILEWQEISSSCPVCSKLMVYEQMN